MEDTKRDVCEGMTPPLAAVFFILSGLGLLGGISMCIAMAWGAKVWV